MPRCFVQQPNGLLAIWSSVVDDFVALDCTGPEAVVDELDNVLNQNYPGDLHADLCREMENIGRTGRAWQWAPTWEEALETIRELHGEETLKERLAMLEQESK